MAWWLPSLVSNHRLSPFCVGSISTSDNAVGLSRYDARYVLHVFMVIKDKSNLIQTFMLLYTYHLTGPKVQLCINLLNKSLFINIARLFFLMEAIEVASHMLSGRS